MKFSNLLIFTILFSAGAHATVNQPDVVYGEDGRFEPYDRPNFHDETRSVAAQINKKHFGVESLIGYSIVGPTHQQGYHLCNGEKFSDQPVIANCSGALVAPDVIMTAGHCLETVEDCKNFDWVFGYEMNQKSGNPKTLERNNTYQCKQVIAQSLINGVDYAFVRLDRKVIGREPMKLAPQSYKAKIGDSLVMFGYPSGLPLKVTEGGRVNNIENHLLVTTLDAFHVNSGSPVIDEKSGEIVGILVSGRPDYVPDHKRGCDIVNVLPESMGGERVTSLHVVPRNF
ncbi:MAG: trypsin-like peptidase domain-containing protein [Bdellovibrionales bacterium]|nr:trypsin-like peptidase domain-containing protein [Bdellovibrionales bacterium]